MTEQTKPSRVLVKEIQIDRGVFSIKSETTQKFSASESYKEQIQKKGLPPEAPKEFKEAIPHLYYAPENKDLISYTKLHSKINHERDLILKSHSEITDEVKKQAQIESSKKVLKEYGINDKALMIYSPQIAHHLEEEDEFCKVSVTYHKDEKTLFVKTELLPREKKDLPQEIVIGEMIDLINLAHIKNGNQEQEHNQTEEVHHSKTEEYHPDAEMQSKVDEAKKVNIDDIKKKYNFARPKSESISDILKRTSGKDSQQNSSQNHESPEIAATRNLKGIITEGLHNSPGSWIGNEFNVDFPKTGYLVPVETVKITSDHIYIKSSQITNIEWWTKFTPIHQCKRFEGALFIPDDYAPSCKEAKCNTACGAEDGFVELSAARFRLIEESEIIKNEFQRLQQFLDRCYNLMEEFKSTYDVDIKMDISSNKPFFYSNINLPAEEFVVQNHIEAFQTLYAEITDIRGKVDIDSFVLDEDYDPVSEDGLVQESRIYSLQEMVRLGAEDLLKNIVKQKDGRIDNKFYLIENGRIRYNLKPHSIEAFREDLYMGNINFKKGLKEVEHFLSTTLGGGRW